MTESQKPGTLSILKGFASGFAERRRKDQEIRMKNQEEVLRQRESYLKQRIKVERQEARLRKIKNSSRSSIGRGLLTGLQGVGGALEGFAGVPPAKKPKTKRKRAKNVIKIGGKKYVIKKTKRKKRRTFGL